MAACLPQEQVASLAQMQPPSRPQQVAGTAAVAVDMMCDVVDWLAGKCWSRCRWRYDTML